MAKAKSLKLDIEGYKAEVLKRRAKHIEGIPSYFSAIYNVDEIIECGCKCYRITPRSDFEGKYIFYTYGSFMSENISEKQWAFVYRLLASTNQGVVVPIYPLAPEYSCGDTFDMLIKAYTNFSKGIDINKITLLGDSAGAGLALSLALLSWDIGFKKPDKLILLSPVVDMEYFDNDLYEQVLRKSHKEPKYKFTETKKKFLNAYWVKDYAIRTEYTSPFYHDLRALCDEIVIVSSIDDLYNSYARALYKNAKNAGLDAKFYEFENETHNFLIESDSDETEKAFSYLVDDINGTFKTSMSEIYQIKLISDWSKMFPRIVSDDGATKFIEKNNIVFPKSMNNISEYRNLLLASRHIYTDCLVKQFILEYPNGTVVNVGCRLDNRFGRMDNGRIQWYNVDNHNAMSVRRAIYSAREREITIGRDIMNFSWLDEINCNRDQGVLFIFNDSLSTMRSGRVRFLIDTIALKFPSAHVLLLASDVLANFYTNHRYKNSPLRLKKKLFSVGDPAELFGGWRIDYRVKTCDAVTNILPPTKGLKLKTKLGIWYNKASLNHKIVELRLGGEVYEVKV